MKKAMVIVWCLLYILLASACKNGDPTLQTNNSSDTAEAVASSATEDTAASPATEDTVPSSQSTEPSATSKQEESYKNIVCAKVSDFREVSFFISDSRTQINIDFPKQWTLQENGKDYSIIKASEVIGSVTASDVVESESLENVYSRKRTTPGVTITSRIDRIGSEGEAKYIRAISYRYKETDGITSTITVTVPYEMIDDDAVWTMMLKVEKNTAPDPQMGVFPLTDNRKGVLILGNSFVGTSKVGITFQEMCGAGLWVEAQSRGYARVTTYVQDENLMNRIRAGEYAAVILCGLYEMESLIDVEHMVNACASSDTKLAIFPAHNEKETLIASVSERYPSAVLLDWKGEIDSLITSGINETHFCINDSHKHSTPLAGYVGAHMLYRAIFGEVPAKTSYSTVSQWEIALLGQYASTGSVPFSDPDSTYAIKAG